MAEEVTPQGTPDESQTPQGTPVPESEVTPQGTPPEVEVLPSDTETFTIPDKFQGKSAEEIAKAYVELEKFKASGETPPANETPPTPNEETPPDPSNEQSNTKYFDEFIESGTLSEESFQELEAKGHKRQEVQERLEFDKYRQDQRISKVTESIGGLEEYQKMEAWAVENVAEADRNTFTQEFASASDYAKKAMLESLYGQYSTAVGSNAGPEMVHTNESQYSVTKGYSAQHELQADMADPRYGTDRSYTKAVEAKLAKTKAF